MSNSGRLPANSSGNYDYPPAFSPATLHAQPNTEAGRRTRFLPTETIARLSQFTRNIIDQHRESDETTGTHSAVSSTNTPPLPTSSPDSRRRMRNVLSRLSDLARESNENLDNTEQHQSIFEGMDLGATQNSRPRANPGGRFQRRQQNRENRSRAVEGAALGSAIDMAEFREAGDRLAQINEDARTLLNRPLNMQQIGEAGSLEMEGQHRRKRQRTRTTSIVREYPSVNYGHYGQVVPGKLDMQLVSTDGGTMEPFLQRHCPENMLKDDLSVHCTQSPRCNIVLRHKGGTTFSLDKLVVKAPKSGFTDPSVRVGLVFVTMKQDDMFERTMRYRIYHLPSSRFASSINSRQSRHESPVEDPYGEPLEPQRGERRRSAQRSHEITRVSTTADAADSSDSSDEESGPRYMLSESVAHTSTSGSGEEQEMDDGHDAEHTESSTNAVQDTVGYWEYRYRDEQEAGGRGPRPPIWAQRLRFTSGRHHSPGSSDYQDMLQQLDFDEVLRRGETASADRRRRRQAMQARADSRAELSEGERANLAAERRRHSNPTDATNTTSSLELLTPVVRFSMKPHVSDEDRNADIDDFYDVESDSEAEAEQDGLVQIPECTTTSNRVSIRFHPPLSGKFILLKLWSPRESGNIDIENISAYGYAGVRFFPSVECR